VKILLDNIDRQILMVLLADEWISSQKQSAGPRQVSARE